MGIEQQLLLKMQTLSANVADLHKVVVEVAAAMGSDFGKVNALLPYPLLDAVNQKKINYHREWALDADEANLKAAWEASQPIREQNQVICKQNRVLVDKVASFLEPIGLPNRKVYRPPVTRSRNARGSEEQYGWKDSLSVVQTVDLAWESLDRQYKERLAGIEKERGKKEQEKVTAEIIRKREEEKLEAEVARREVSRGLGLPAGSEWYEVMNVLLQKNKYLRLAYWLQRNRGDWSEGFDYARTGLDGFSVENETDARISSELQSLIDEWCGDGRVFRDCNWSYGKLFEMAATQDPELFSLYQKAAAIDEKMRGQ